MNKNTIITISNTKGGCGKSTLAFLIAHYLALEKNWQESQGFKRKKIGLIDLDHPQYTSKTFYLNSKKNFNNKLIRPVLLTYDKEVLNLKNFQDYLKSLEDEFDYIIIDSGGHYDEITPIVINVADILVTPVINNLVDFNVLFTYNNEINQMILGAYTEFVKRNKNPQKKLSWYVIPNRCNPIITEYSTKCLKILHSMSDLIGFKVTNNIIDRSVYSQGFDLGLNIFDNELNSYFHNSPISITNSRKEIIDVIQYILK